MFRLHLNVMEICNIERDSLICNSTLQRHSLSTKLHGAKVVCFYATMLIQLFNPGNGLTATRSIQAEVCYRQTRETYKNAKKRDPENSAWWGKKTIQNNLRAIKTAYVQISY